MTEVDADPRRVFFDLDRAVMLLLHPQLIFHTTYLSANACLRIPNGYQAVNGIWSARLKSNVTHSSGYSISVATSLVFGSITAYRGMCSLLVGYAQYGNVLVGGRPQFEGAEPSAQRQRQRRYARNKPVPTIANW